MRVRDERRIGVGVLVNLEFDAPASGHVNVWKRYAEAVAGRDDIDLTVYFLGPRRTVPVAANVHYELVPGVLPTRTLRLRQGAGHADIGPWHPALARLLRRHDVLHATDFFCFGTTARRVARSRGLPFVYSIHTLQPEFSRIYWPEIAEGLFGQGFIWRFLINNLKTQDWIAGLLGRGLVRQLHAADRVLVFHPGNIPRNAALAPGRILPLRRGSDLAAFRPGLRDPDALRRRFAIPDGRRIALFVGRLDESKGARLVADALARLVARGMPVHGLFVGRGRDGEAVRRRLGENATLTGILPQDELPAIYASADLLAFPALYETWGNVVLEAKASGLPTLVPSGQATARHIGQDGEDGVLVADRTPEAWAAAIETLLRDEPRRAAIARAARQWCETHALSWTEAVEQDLLPVWRAVARLRIVPLATAVRPG